MNFPEHDLKYSIYLYNEIKHVALVPLHCVAEYQSLALNGSRMFMMRTTTLGTLKKRPLT